MNLSQVLKLPTVDLNTYLQCCSVVIIYRTWKNPGSTIQETQLNRFQTWLKFIKFVIFYFQDQLNSKQALQDQMVTYEKELQSRFVIYEKHDFFGIVFFFKLSHASLLRHFHKSSELTKYDYLPVFSFVILKIILINPLSSPTFLIFKQ